jgi:phage baseplate assembly protein gpV
MLNNLNQVEQHDYSKNIFVGKVVYNEDPLRLKRVKVSIPNLFNETDHANLPWVAPMFFGFVANGAGGGSAHLVPAVGTELVIEFQMGSPLHGLYVASPVRLDQLPTEFRDGDFKWTYGWKDPAGNLFLVDTKDGNNLIKIVHGSSGATWEIVNNGDTTFTTPGKLDLTVGGTTTLNSEGRVTVNTEAQVHVNGSNVMVNGGDVIADGISLKTHVHDGVQAGPSNTGQPVG